MTKISMLADPQSMLSHLVFCKSFRAWGRRERERGQGEEE